MGMANQKAKVGTETGDVAPVAGGLSPLEGILGRVKPTHIEVEHKLRQAIYYQVGPYIVISTPSGLEISWYGYKFQIRVDGANLEVPSFHQPEDPEPSLYEVLDYWLDVIDEIKYMAEDMADILKEAEAKA